ncbi:MAG TPA: cupredoxin domain-containing protein [Patescibacteria group bacterium]
MNNNSGQNQISGVKVSVTDNGFEPSSVTIGAGQTVTFTNNSSNPVFVASDPHPTHTNLPEFQSKNVAVGESYSFTFNQLGSWGYHNHLNPSVRGTVVVN